jgi:hypothetical protein
MKTCPVCHRPYADETLIFCLADGTKLINESRKLDLDATWRISPPAVKPSAMQIAPTVGAAQTDESAPQSTIQYRPELQMARPPSLSGVAANPGRSILPWLFAIVVVLAGSGVLVAWILTRSRTENAQATQPAAAQQAPSPEKSGTKAVTVPEKTQAVNVPPIIKLPTSAKTHTSTPGAGRKSTVRSESDKNAVVPEKKKVEPPKPTGESFIPVKP